MGCGTSRPPVYPQLVGEWISLGVDGNDSEDKQSDGLSPERLRHILDRHTKTSKYKITNFGYKNPGNLSPAYGSLFVIREDGWMRYLELDPDRGGVAYTGPITKWDDTILQSVVGSSTAGTRSSTGSVPAVRWVGCCPSCRGGRGCISFEAGILNVRGVDGDGRPQIEVNGRIYTKINF